MLTIPFLTDLDPQAAVKGSRDPLGVQPIWSRMGRHVVGNLTTVTTSVRGFTTLILGYYFAERVANEEGGDGDLGVFLRWEQLAAYARGDRNGDWDFLGVRRVKRTFNENERIRLGIDPTAQILSNQKTYGLWGLYTVPSRASGLIHGEPTRLTPAARDLVERVYLPIFGECGFRNADAIVARLAKAKTDIDLRGADRRLVDAVAKVLAKRLFSSERAFYEEHLLLGGPEDATSGRQAILARAFEHTLEDSGWELTPVTVRQLAKQSRGQGVLGAVVEERLERIRTAELLLAPAVRLYSFLLGSDGQAIADVAKATRRHWGSGVRTIDTDRTRFLEADLSDASGDSETSARWLRIAEALKTGEYDAALTLLMEQNSFVMNVRGGSAAWADIVDGRLRVKLKDEAVGGLPAGKDLPRFWIHPYFLGSMRAIALAVRN